MIILALGLFGLIFGSFVNALVWRLHEQAALEGNTSKAAQKHRKELSITQGRSMCPHCKHGLAPKDLIPVVSWVYLQGKCRYCHAPIPDSPLVELSVAALFVISYLSWPLGFRGVGRFEFIVWLFFIVAFVALAVYDLRWFLLPDKIVFPLIVVASLEVGIVALWSHSVSALWQPLLAGLIIFGLFWTLYQVSKGAWIGGGDVKLALLLGLIAATPLKAFLVIFFASLLGTVVSIPLLAKGKAAMKIHIPFGPYLLAALIVVQLYGQHIINWYQNLLV